MKRETTRKKIVRTFLKNRAALVGLVGAVMIIAISLMATVLSPHDPIAQSMGNRLKAPNWTHLFGTDDYGRDLLSRILYGSRLSLMVGVLSVGLGMAAGIFMGVVAGFKGGVLDNIIMRSVDIFMSFPTLLLGLIVLAVLGQGMFKLVIAIAIAIAPRFARLSRGSVISIKQNDYVDAARTIGMSNARIMFGHILPNIIGDLLVMGTLWTATAIRVEASLSFIGLGMPPPDPTWGGIVKQGIEFLDSAPWISLYGGLAIMITVLCFNMVGDGLRDIIDPKLRS